ncbi:unnamed protein product, partial [Owenia fusiformis]
TVKDCVLDDEAEYTINVQEKKSQAKLTVQELPIEFLDPLKNVFVVENETATLDTEVSKPDQKATWFMDGELLKPSDKYEMKVDGTKHYLVVHDCELDDEADYTIRIDKKESTAMILVEEAPLVFMTPLKDVTVMEKETASFECEISKPDQKATWYIEGEEVQESERVQIDMDSTIHSLTIKDCVLDDEAEYSIKIQDVTSKATLYVDESPVEFIKPLQDMTVF